MRTLRTFACLAVAALSIHAAEIPRKAPDLAIHLNSGKDLQVNSHRGKAICVAFILTTCPHCQNTTRILSRAQNDFGARGFQVVEASIEENGKALVPGFIQDYNPPFPVGYLELDTAQTYLQHSPMMMLHMPAILFIDRQGRIVAQFEGSDSFMEDAVQEKNIRAKIEQLLGPPARSKR
jgi:cytochrome oxidase Cu insertion factor (SCO1/SenC/PrrC family)